MSATTVSSSTLLPDVVLVAQSPLHLNNFCKYLANHPDQVWCNKWLYGIECGINIGFWGWEDKHGLGQLEVSFGSLILEEYLANEVAVGCKAGPFAQPPFPDFVGSLMGIVAKKFSLPVKYRIIHDLSWPPQDSVNDHIDPDAFRCFYGSFNEAVDLVVKHRVGTLSAKLDQADAFKHILVRNQDWPLLGSSWGLQCLDGSTCHLYYMDHFLPFGLLNPPALFNEYADALQYNMKSNEVHDLLHYLDDYFTVGLPHSLVCANNITTMIATCEELGFTINMEKITKPATTTNFLGWTLTQLPWKPELIPSAYPKPFPYSRASWAIDPPPKGPSYFI